MKYRKETVIRAGRTVYCIVDCSTNIVVAKAKARTLLQHRWALGFIEKELNRLNQE